MAVLEAPQHWHVTGPHLDPHDGTPYWVWSVQVGVVGGGGSAKSRERAVELAEDAYRKLAGPTR